MSEEHDETLAQDRGWRPHEESQLETDAYHIWKPRPLLRSISWKPTPEVPREAAAGAYEVFVDQRAFAAMHQHVWNASEGEEPFGYLVGDLCEDPDSNRRYLIVSAALPSRFRFEEDGQEPISGEASVALQLEVDRRRGVVAGWYHRHRSGEAQLSESDAAVHEKLFREPWHVAFIFVTDPRRPSGACFRRTRAGFSGELPLPFFEMVSNESLLAKGVRRSRIDWVNVTTHDAILPDAAPRPEVAPAEPPEELEAEVRAELQSQVEPEADVAPEVEAEEEPEVELEAEPAAEVEAEPVPELEEEPEPEPEAAVEPELAPEAELEPEPEAEAERLPDVEAEVEEELEDLDFDALVAEVEQADILAQTEDEAEAEVLVGAGDSVLEPPPEIVSPPAEPEVDAPPPFELLVPEEVEEAPVDESMIVVEEELRGIEAPVSEATAVPVEREEPAPSPKTVAEPGPPPAAKPAKPKRPGRRRDLMLVGTGLAIVTAVVASLVTFVRQTEQESETDELPMEVPVEVSPADQAAGVPVPNGGSVAGGGEVAPVPAVTRERIEELSKGLVESISRYYGLVVAIDEGRATCAELQEAYVTVEERWITYSVEGRSKWPGLLPRDLAERDERLYRGVRDAEGEFDRSGCQRP